METDTTPILGIDLGTTNSAIGVVDSGFPILLADADGKRLTRSAVFYPEDGGAPLVGETALRAGGINPERLVTSVKRLIGRRHDEVDETPTYGITEGNSGETAIRVGDRILSPETVSSEILRHLKTVAERATGSPVTRAVVTVPAYFNDGQRNATKRAAEQAGLKVVRILNEPTAAALAYGLDKLGEKSKIAVYDLGGGTFDVSVLELDGGVFHVLATRGDTHLGGDDLDAALADYLWEKSGSDKTLAETPPATRRRLTETAEQAKIALSTAPAHTVRLPFLEGCESFEHEVTRETHERLCTPVIRRTVAPCRHALADAGLEAGDLDAVILVGGSTRIPAVRALAADIFGQPPNTTQHPDEAVALGAVIQAGVLSGSLRQMVLLDVTPLSLGIETFGGLMNVIIPRNTTIPAKAGEMFTNAVPGQESMRLRVLQGEREIARDNWELGQFDITFEPGPKASARVGVQFHIDENGILEVLARDTKTDIDTVLEIQNSAVDVGDSQVEKMISESVEHAFEDFEERRWTEQRLKAEELLEALDRALSELGKDVTSDLLEQVSADASQVRSALGQHDLAALEKANKTLDQSSEPLAEQLIEKLLEDSPFRG